MRNIILTIIFVGTIGIALAGCGSRTLQHKPQAAASISSVHAATVKSCKKILAFEMANAKNTFQNDPASIQAENDADGTPLETDLTNWVNDLRDTAIPFQQFARDTKKVGADCKLVGVVLFPAGWAFA